MVPELTFPVKNAIINRPHLGKKGVSVCFHYLKVNTCNVYALYVCVVLNPFHTIFSLVTSLPYPLDIKSIFFNSNSTSMSTMKLCI